MCLGLWKLSIVQTGLAADLLLSVAPAAATSFFKALAVAPSRRSTRALLFSMTVSFSDGSSNRI